MASMLVYQRATLRDIKTKVEELGNELKLLTDLEVRSPTQLEQLEIVYSKLKANLKHIQSKTSMVANAALSESNESTQTELISIEKEMHEKDVEVHVLLSKASRIISEDKPNLQQQLAYCQS